MFISQPPGAEDSAGPGRPRADMTQIHLSFLFESLEYKLLNSSDG